jgi:hypothetical protein
MVWIAPMSSKAESDKPAPAAARPAEDAREARLAAALRANLRRRKAKSPPKPA